MTLYEVLDVSSDSTSAEIARTYARRRDTMGFLGDMASSLQLFADIDYAYSVLSDPRTRRRYDTAPQDFLEFHPVPTII